MRSRQTQAAVAAAVSDRQAHLGFKARVYCSAWPNYSRDPNALVIGMG